MTQIESNLPAGMRHTFISAALFNWGVGAGLLILWQWVLPLLQTPSPEHPVFVHFTAWLVLSFGLGYYWVSRHPRRNRAIILLGVIGKIGVFLIGTYYGLLSLIGWPLAALTGVDLIYAMIFLYYWYRLGES